MKNEIKTELIDEFMRKNGVSKSRFCKMCKISLGTYRKIERGDLDFRITALFKIAKVLGIEVCELFYESAIE